MALIDSEKLKQASDAAQAAKKIWSDTNEALQNLRNRDPKNEHELMLARARVETARERLDVLNAALASQVHDLIAEAITAK